MVCHSLCFCHCSVAELPGLEEGPGREKSAKAAGPAQRTRPQVSPSTTDASAITNCLSGWERTAEPRASSLAVVPPLEAAPGSEPAIGSRADAAAGSRKGKTVLPKIANGGYKLPPTSLLHRAEGQQSINEAEV